MPQKAQIPGNRRNVYFSICKLRNFSCLEPTEACDRTAIRAHSIQNGRVLDELVQDGHVIMLQLRHGTDGAPSIEYRLVGRNEASTFTGLCSQHDAAIFAPIDSQLPDPADPEHRFLIAYRSVLRETHACIEAACKFQRVYQDRVERGLSPAHKPDSAGRAATEWLANAYDCYLYKRRFDSVYLKRRFAVVCHEQLQFRDTPASIAVSSLFSLDDTQRPGDVARIALSVFPDRGHVHVVFSYLQCDARVASRHLSRLLCASPEHQKYLVSKLVLQHCENFVFAPSYFDRLPEARRQRIREFFVSTVLQNRDGHEDKDLYLF